jgi:hypothetical protein
MSAFQVNQSNNDIENNIENNIENLNASNAKAKREQELDNQIDLKLSTMEENNREQHVYVMALIDERYHINDSVGDFNKRLRNCFYISHLHENASRIEIFGAATDHELSVYGL